MYHYRVQSHQLEEIALGDLSAEVARAALS